jgi:hypothetical protein
MIVEDFHNKVGTMLVNWLRRHGFEFENHHPPPPEMHFSIWRNNKAERLHFHVEHFHYLRSDAIQVIYTLKDGKDGLVAYSGAGFQVDSIDAYIDEVTERIARWARFHA